MYKSRSWHGLIAQYVGQTGPLVRKTFEKALGQVLFIDEAYLQTERRCIFQKSHFRRNCLFFSLRSATRARSLPATTTTSVLTVNKGLSSHFIKEVIFVTCTRKNAGKRNAEEYHLTRLRGSVQLSFMRPCRVLDRFNSTASEARQRNFYIFALRRPLELSRSSFSNL
jgi:hypothetical protein